jgi:hypothetical protein
MHKSNLRIIAFLLLLAFVQRLGMQVLLHNKYHAPAVQNHSASAAGYYQVQCDCLDDALVPLSRAETVQLPQPAEGFAVSHGIYSVCLSSAVKIFSSLRGPPAL